MSKQDRQGVRTAPDLERKYDFGRAFTDVRSSIRLVGKTAEQAMQTAVKAEESFRSEIKQLSNSIILEVAGDQSGKVAQIKLYVGTGDDAASYSGKIDMTGMVTFSDLFKADGTTVIDGGNINTGTLDASKITVINLSADAINTGRIRSTDFQLSNYDIFYPASNLYPSSALYPSNGEQIVKGFEIDFESGVIRGVLWSDVADTLSKQIEALDARITKLEQSLVYPISKS